MNNKNAKHYSIKRLAVFINFVWNNQELYASDFKLFANLDANRNSYWVTRNTSMCNATEHRVWGRVWNRVGKCEDKWRFGTTTTKGYVWWRLLLGEAIKSPRGGPLGNSARAMAVSGHDQWFRSCRRLNTPVENSWRHQPPTQILFHHPVSNLQQDVDHMRNWSQENLLQLNPSKCKEVLTCFKRTPVDYATVEIDRLHIQKDQSAKVLCLTNQNKFKMERSHRPT